MRRRLFFWLDKLKITRTERQAISILLIVFAALLLLNAAISPSSPFDNKYYSELDARFKMRTALMQQEEQQILSRYPGEQPSNTSTDTLGPDSAAGQTADNIPEAALININTADASALQQLRGIGAAYARRIIEYRQQNGPFKTGSGLLNIKGIGKIRLRKISPFITLGDEDELEEKNKIEAKIKVINDQVKAEVQEKGRDENEIDSNAKVANEAAFIINVNKANAAALQNLSGIGPTYARRIVEYRQLNGSFQSKLQLLNIKGIGEKRLAKIKPFIKLTDQH